MTTEADAGRIPSFIRQFHNQWSKATNGSSSSIIHFSSHKYRYVVHFLHLNGGFSKPSKTPTNSLSLHRFSTENGCGQSPAAGQAAPASTAVNSIHPKTIPD
jgi:hypothetical protein